MPKYRIEGDNVVTLSARLMEIFVRDAGYGEFRATSKDGRCRIVLVERSEAAAEKSRRSLERRRKARGSE